MKREYVYLVIPMYAYSTFPDDMLRYDAARIVCKHDGYITIAGRYPPTVERWRSFGWNPAPAKK